MSDSSTTAKPVHSCRRERDARADRGCGAKLVREFVEVESGRNDERPQLAAALAHARRAKATLLVAKLNRLSRSVKFIATIMDSNVEFAACDLPGANRMTLHVLAAAGENEAREISKNTRDALQAAIARGVKLGTHNPRVPVLSAEKRREGAALGALANRRNAVEVYSDLAPVVQSLRRRGATLCRIAEHLNAEGHTTQTGASWTSVQVHRLLSRASAA